MSARRYAPPRPLPVDADARTGEPTALRWRGRLARVARIEATWTVDTGLWPGEPETLRRRYFRVLTHDGLLCEVFRDMAGGSWFLARILD